MMKLRNGLFAIFTLTLLSFAGLFAVFQTIDPYATDWFSRAMFYVFLFLTSGGATTLILYYSSHKKNRENLYVSFQNYLRIGMSVGFAITGLMVLETINVLNILSATVYILAIILIEFYLRARKKNYA